jgi:pyrroline-5-carboxylate reductase
MMATIGFLGFGNMGRALASGIVEAGLCAAPEVVVYDSLPACRDTATALGMTVADSEAALAAKCDCLVLAVKPQAMEEALKAALPGMRPGTLVVSIAAGLSTRFYEGLLGGGARVARAMPNTPAMVRAGATAVAFTPACTGEDRALAKSLFEAVGVCVTVDESCMDAVTALSGSGPAYFFLMVEHLARAAVAEGLSEADAALLAGQTLLGAGRLLAESGESAAALRARVTSKGGTTAAALARFEEGGFAELAASAVAAAAARSRELGR